MPRSVDTAPARPVGPRPGALLTRSGRVELRVGTVDVGDLLLDPPTWQGWAPRDEGVPTPRLLARRGPRSLWGTSAPDGPRQLVEQVRTEHGRRARLVAVDPGPTAEEVLDPSRPVEGIDLVAWDLRRSDDRTHLTWRAADDDVGPLGWLWLRAAGQVGTALEQHARTLQRLAAVEGPGAVRAAVEICADRAEDTTRARTLDRSAVAALRTAGLFRLGVPRALGGVDLPGHVLVDLVEQVSHGDGSAGWTTFIGNQASYLAWLPEVRAARFAGTEGTVLAGTTAPTGQGRWTLDGHVRVTGRWRFASGCLHADVLMAGFLALDPRGGGPPTPWVAFVDPADVTIHATWDTVGLAGTGSHDLVADDLAVPADQVVRLSHDHARSGEALHRLSPFDQQAVLMLGVPLGLAGRVLAEVATWAGADATPGAREDAATELAFADLRLRALRSLVRQHWGSCWPRLAAGEGLGEVASADTALLLRHVCDEARELVRGPAARTGAWQLQAAGRVLARSLADLQAVGQHIAVSDEVVDRNVARLTQAGVGR